MASIFPTKTKTSWSKICTVVIGHAHNSSFSDINGRSCWLYDWQFKNISSWQAFHFLPILAVFFHATELYDIIQGLLHIWIHVSLKPKKECSEINCQIDNKSEN